MIIPTSLFDSQFCLLFKLEKIKGTSWGITATWMLWFHPLGPPWLLLFGRSAVYGSLWPVDCSMQSLSFPEHHYLPELAQTHVHWVDNAIQPSHPLSPPSPALNLSQHQGLFQWVSSSHQVAKVQALHFSVSPSDEYLGLISFRIDWFDLLAVLGTL